MRKMGECHSEPQLSQLSPGWSQQFIYPAPEEGIFNRTFCYQGGHMGQQWLFLMAVPSSLLPQGWLSVRLLQSLLVTRLVVKSACLAYLDTLYSIPSTAPTRRSGAHL